jgi:hypothetical protein
VVLLVSINQPHKLPVYDDRIDVGMIENRLNVVDI